MSGGYREDTKRLTKQKLDDVKRSYHIDLKDSGAYRTGGVDNSMYAKNLYVESLVAEVEACWKGRKKLRGELKACQQTMLSLSAKLAIANKYIDDLKVTAVGCPVCPYKGNKPCWHCKGCAYK